MNHICLYGELFVGILCSRTCLISCVKFSYMSQKYNMDLFSRDLKIKNYLVKEITVKLMHHIINASYNFTKRHKKKIH